MSSPSTLEGVNHFGTFYNINEISWNVPKTLFQMHCNILLQGPFALKLTESEMKNSEHLNFLRYKHSIVLVYFIQLTVKVEPKALRTTQDFGSFKANYVYSVVGDELIQVKKLTCGKNYTPKTVTSAKFQ